MCYDHIMRQWNILCSYINNIKNSCFRVLKVLFDSVLWVEQGPLLIGYCQGDHISTTLPIHNEQIIYKLCGINWVWSSKIQSEQLKVVWESQTRYTRVLKFEKTCTCPVKQREKVRTLGYTVTSFLLSYFYTCLRNYTTALFWTSIDVFFPQIFWILSAVIWELFTVL